MISLHSIIPEFNNVQKAVIFKLHSLNYPVYFNQIKLTYSLSKSSKMKYSVNRLLRHGGSWLDRAIRDWEKAGKPEPWFND